MAALACMEEAFIKLLRNIEPDIAPVLVGHSPDALEMDLKMIESDGTPDKSKLGANANLPRHVSMALFGAQALCEEMDLYEFIATNNGLRQ